MCIRVYVSLEGQFSSSARSCAIGAARCLSSCSYDGHVRTYYFLWQIEERIHYIAATTVLSIKKKSHERERPSKGDIAQREPQRDREGMSSDRKYASVTLKAASSRISDG
uniref:Uncharacterized protein n=1 Tax=Trichogramma kaykai TaxID=54128 RepID=A0ABD2X1G8_9HYME